MSPQHYFEQKLNTYSMTYFGQYPLEAYLLGHKWAANANIPVPKYDLPYIEDGRLFRATVVAIEKIEHGQDALYAIRTASTKYFAPMLDIARILGNRRGRRDVMGLS